jgi:hypothetical protein
MRVRSLLAVGIIAATAVACADLFGFKDLQEGAPDASDAQVADVNDASAPDVATCTPATWPANPTTASAGTTPNNFVVALRHVYFSSAPDGGVAGFGYDLDGKCTTNDPTASCTSTNGVTDLPNGVDDESITLMGTLVSLASTLSDDAVNGDIAAGNFDILFRILSYNGATDVPLSKGMQVAVQASPGIVGAGPAKFDGTDQWTVSVDDSLSTTSTYPAAQLVKNAYVANGTLVMTLNSTLTIHVVLPAPALVSGPLAIILHQPTITAKLVPNGTGWDLTDGLIVGRWSTSDILANVASLSIDAGGPVDSLCDHAGGSIFTLVTTKVCTDTDITAAGPDDNTHPCDAVSVAVGFDGVAADVAGNPVPFPTSSTPCSHDAGNCN